MRTAVVSAALVILAGSAWADPVADFYKGRTMTVVISGSTGSTYDIGTRLSSIHEPPYSRPAADCAGSR
jgi:tripartite-type tricarboxylate transporter receptor subunit TctC